MSKLNWQIYSARLKKAGVTKAEITRKTGIDYSRLVGFFNGYWDLRAEELAKVDAVLSASAAEGAA
ncbi:MAG: helix-turn-helix transcriptional regulator [Chitinispirillia bacterium]|nr:helix-turn-helix transcriptional regulator [Chitinispirillia bacterium]